jgi:hypothetical protein
LSSFSKGIYSPNSIAVANMVQYDMNLPDVAELARVERGLLQSSIEIEKEAGLGNFTAFTQELGRGSGRQEKLMIEPTNLDDDHIPKIMKRVPSVDYPMDSEEEASPRLEASGDQLR